MRSSQRIMAEPPPGVNVSQLDGKVVAHIPFDDVVASAAYTLFILERWSGDEAALMLDFSNIIKVVAHYSGLGEASIADVWSVATNKSIGGTAFLKLVQTAVAQAEPVELLVVYRDDDQDAPVVPRDSPDRQHISKSELQNTFNQRSSIWSMHSNQHSFGFPGGWRYNSWWARLDEVDNLPQAKAYLNKDQYIAYAEAVNGYGRKYDYIDHEYKRVLNATDPIVNPTVAAAVADVKRNAFDNYETFVDILTDGEGEELLLNGPFTRYASIVHDPCAYKNEGQRAIQMAPGLYGELLVTIYFVHDGYSRQVFPGSVTPEDVPRIHAHLQKRARHTEGQFCDVASLAQ
jgi:hypothetical protein